MVLQTLYRKQWYIATHNTHTAMIYPMDERKWKEGKSEKKKFRECKSSSAGVAVVDASLGENHVGMVKQGRLSTMACRPEASQQRIDARSRLNASWHRTRQRAFEKWHTHFSASLSDKWRWNTSSTTTLAKKIETTTHWGTGTCSLEHARACSLACMAGCLNFFGQGTTSVHEYVLFTPEFILPEMWHTLAVCTAVTLCAFSIGRFCIL